MQVDKELVTVFMPISLMFVSLQWFYYMYQHTTMFIFGEYTTGFKCHKKYEGTHNIYQQMNLCLQLSSECFLGKLKKSSE